jgi:Protein of unknown function (DUF3301)
LHVLEVWLPLILCMVLGGLWYHVLRLREHAVTHARELCARHGVQLLDDSVSLQRLRLARRHGTLQILREYRFDTSLGGNDRQVASITLCDERLVHVRMPARESVPPPACVQSSQPCIHVFTPTEPGGNVIPITRARHTLH